MVDGAHVDDSTPDTGDRPTLETPERGLLAAVLSGAIDGARAGNAGDRAWLRDRVTMRFASARFCCDHLNVSQSALLSKLEADWASAVPTLSWADLLDDDVASTLGPVGHGMSVRAMAIQGNARRGDDSQRDADGSDRVSARLGDARHRVASHGEGH